MNALELNGVVKKYGKRKALDNIDLHVPVGSIFGLVGSNGAGKTTAMAVVVGLLRIDAGTVSLFGEGPFDPALHCGRVTLLPQDSRLPLHSKVDDLLLYYGRLQRLPEPVLRDSIDEVLEWVHLSDRRKSVVRSLSHGMMRRLTIAQAFLGKPELVLLDEPMSGLDPREAARIRNILAEKNGAQTVVISSHNLHELESLCDTAAFIEHGTRIRQDTIEMLTNRSQRLIYHIVPADNISVEMFAGLIPDARWELTHGNTQLSLRCKGDSDVTGFNRKVITFLLARGNEIIEVRRGSNLESEYLAITASM